MKNLIFFKLKIFTLLLLNYGCDPDRNCPQTLHYDVPVEVLNPTDTMFIGDTIWFRSFFNKKLIDRNGNVENTFENYDFSIMATGLYKIDSTEDQGGNFNTRLVNRVGMAKYQLVGGAFDIYRLHYQYDGNNYSIEFGLVINDPGLFIFQSGYVDFGGPKLFDVYDNCTRSVVEFGYRLTPYLDTYDRLKSSPVPFWRDYPRADFDRWGSYCVYVKP